MSITDLNFGSSACYYLQLVFVANCNPIWCCTDV